MKYTYSIMKVFPLSILKVIYIDTLNQQLPNVIIRTKGQRCIVCKCQPLILEGLLSP